MLNPLLRGTIKSIGLFKRLIEKPWLSRLTTPAAKAFNRFAKQSLKLKRAPLPNPRPYSYKVQSPLIQKTAALGFGLASSPFYGVFDVLGVDPGVNPATTAAAALTKISLDKRVYKGVLLAALGFKGIQASGDVLRGTQDKIKETIGEAKAKVEAGFTAIENRFETDAHLAPVYRSNTNATERQRALQAMRKQGIKGRFAFGQEARHAAS